MNFEILVIDEVCSAKKNLSIHAGIYINFVRVLSQAEFYSVSYRCAGSYWKESGDLLLHSCSNVPRIGLRREKLRNSLAKGCLSRMFLRPSPDLLFSYKLSLCEVEVFNALSVPLKEILFMHSIVDSNLNLK